MNAGAYGGEIRAVCRWSQEMLPDGTLVRREGVSQGFGYRTSVFQHTDGVIVRACFALQPGDPGIIRETMRELMTRRTVSQPLDLPSAGSAFKRPQGGYAAALIESAGLKGLTVGGAQVSEKHAGFVVNRGGATAADVLELLRQVQQRVLEHSGIRLEPEIRLWPEADEVFDLRCLKNPYWEPELRELCSQDAPVRDFILHNEQSRTVLNYALSMLLLQADLYAERGWGNDMTVGVGCKGGRHRSVVGAEFLAAGLREHGHTVTVFHRDLSREGNA